MTFSDGALIAGPLLFLYGFFNTIISVYEWHRDMKLFKTGQRAVGMITEAVTYPNDDSVNSGQYRFIADFKTENDITCYAKSRFASRAKEKFLNTEVIIIYDPGDPDNSRFEHDISLIRDVFENVLLLTSGIGLFLYGIFGSG